MSRRLYVGNLPYSMGEQELRAVFAGYAVESATVITDRETGRSKGFGFVEMGRRIVTPDGRSTRSTVRNTAAGSYTHDEWNGLHHEQFVSVGRAKPTPVVVAGFNMGTDREAIIPMRRQHGS